MSAELYTLTMQRSHLPPLQQAPWPPDNYPVENLDKGDDAEAEKEAEESSKRGDEVHRAHSDAPLKFLRETMLYVPPKNTFLTYDSLLAEKDVNNSDILLPGIVEVLQTENEREITTKSKVEISHRGLSD